MMKKIDNTQTNKFLIGFTLIELLVVITIIGILASMILASLVSTKRGARDVRRISDVKQIGLALQIYLEGVGGGQYPVGNSTTCTAPQTPLLADDNYGLQVLVANGYITAVPRDPSNPAACYRYTSGRINGRRTTYQLSIVLEDPDNTAFSGDEDCSSDGVNTPNCAAGATWEGAASNGNDSIDCLAATVAGTDRCYDMTPQESVQ